CASWYSSSTAWNCSFGVFLDWASTLFGSSDAPTAGMPATAHRANIAITARLIKGPPEVRWDRHMTQQVPLSDETCGESRLSLPLSYKVMVTKESVRHPHAVGRRRARPAPGAIGTRFSMAERGGVARPTRLVDNHGVPGCLLDASFRPGR